MDRSCLDVNVAEGFLVHKIGRALNTERRGLKKQREGQQYGVVLYTGSAKIVSCAVWYSTSYAGSCAHDVNRRIRVFEEMRT